MTFLSRHPARVSSVVARIAIRMIGGGERMMALAILAAYLIHPHAGLSQPPNSQKFPCNSENSKPQSPKDPSSKHTVALTWNPSVSLSIPPGLGEGYNVYRLNPDGSCTKLNLYVLNPDGSYTQFNKDLIRATVLEDWFVEADRTYSYAARAVKQNIESDPSNVAEVKIPPV